ncbi:MAG TPA: trigger factor [Dehalococcoidia bacterium]|nr:trigger factor [Dehalococcoidia bacterium]
MKVTAERTEDSQVVLEIEVDQQRFDNSLNKAYRRLVQKTAVPGFRKGKAPREMLERHLGRHRLLHEALDILVPEVYKEAIEQNGVEPIDQPHVEVLQEEPPIIKATVPVQPTVELGGYRSLRVEREPVEVEQEEIEAAIEELRHRYALHEPVERPVQQGDIVRLDIKAKLDGKDFLEEEDAELRLREGQVVIVPGFVEQLVGTAKGVEKVIALAVPEDYQEPALAGKPCEFTVTVKEIKQEILPEPNDDFAREVGEGFPSMQALREWLESEARERKLQATEEAYQDEVLKELVERAETIEYPPVLLDREIDRILRDEARNTGQDVDLYLEQMKLSPEELREKHREQAEERLLRSLVLTRISELEGLTVEHEEIDAEIERMAQSAGQQGDQIRALFGSAAGHEAIGRSLLTRKTMERITDIASGKEVPPVAQDATKATETAPVGETETKEEGELVPEESK